VEKKSKISKSLGAKRDGVCAKVSVITGASYEYVRLVRLGQRNNQMIKEMIIEYAEGESKLLQRLEEIMLDYTKGQQSSPQFLKRKRTNSFPVC
jgi:predicted double-glycine peptidase